jgi:hypothetical protein
MPPADTRRASDGSRRRKSACTFYLVFKEPESGRRSPSALFSSGEPFNTTEGSLRCQALGRISLADAASFPIMLGPALGATEGNGRARKKADRGTKKMPPEPAADRPAAWPGHVGVLEIYAALPVLSTFLSCRGAPPPRPASASLRSRRCLRPRGMDLRQSVIVYRTTASASRRLKPARSRRCLEATGHDLRRPVSVYCTTASASRRLKPARSRRCLEGTGHDLRRPVSVYRTTCQRLQPQRALPGRAKYTIA